MKDEIKIIFTIYAIVCFLFIEIIALAFIVWRTDKIQQSFQGLDFRINQLEKETFPSFYGEIK